MENLVENPDEHAFLSLRTGDTFVYAYNASNSEKNPDYKKFLAVVIFPFRKIEDGKEEMTISDIFAVNDNSGPEQEITISKSEFKRFKLVELRENLLDGLEVSNPEYFV